MKLQRACKKKTMLIRIIDQALIMHGMLH